MTGLEIKGFKKKKKNQQQIISFHSQFDHWSVKCINATPNKQDNVDSESEVVLKHVWFMTVAVRGLPDYSWNLLLT